MVDSISGSGNSQNVQQLNRAQNQRAERIEKAKDAPEIQVKKLDEREAEAAAQNLSSQLADNENATLGKGQLIDQLL